jgi:hypothetical protein
VTPPSLLLLPFPDAVSPRLAASREPGRETPTSVGTSFTTTDVGAGTRSTTTTDTSLGAPSTTTDHEASR